MKAVAILILLASPYALAAGKPMPQAKFAEGIQKSLPELFCGKQTYFRKCFQLSESECGKTAKSAVEECVKGMKEKLPAVIEDKKSGQKWGQEIGNCAGARFELAHSAKKTDSADCKNPEKWK
jgi:hypothetical protein